MSLFEIRDYLSENKLISLTALSQHFHCDADLLRHKIQHWVRRGCVRCFKKAPNCGSKCSACPVSDVELYEWLD